MDLTHRDVAFAVAEAHIALEVIVQGSAAAVMQGEAPTHAGTSGAHALRDHDQCCNEGSGFPKEYAQKSPITHSVSSPNSSRKFFFCCLPDVRCDVLYSV